MAPKAHGKDIFLTIWLRIIVDRLTAQKEAPLHFVVELYHLEQMIPGPSGNS